MQCEAALDPNAPPQKSVGGLRLRDLRFRCITPPTPLQPPQPKRATPPTNLLRAVDGLASFIFLSSANASVCSRRARSALSRSGDAAVARSGAAMLTLTPAPRIGAALKLEAAGRHWPAGRLLATEEESFIS